MSRVGDVIGRLQSNVHGLINITNDVFKHENEPRFDAETANGVDESKCSPDVDFEEDLYFEDDKILRHQNRKLALLTQQSGYMYVKVRSHIVPFFYRRYFCVLTTERENCDSDDSDSCNPSHRVSIKYWRSRLSCTRLPFSSRGIYDLRPVSYTTDIERVRGIKVDLRGGEDFHKTESLGEKSVLGRQYLDKSLSLMKGTNMLSRLTCLKWFKFQPSRNLHSFTVHIDGEEPFFPRLHFKPTEVTFASENLMKLMQWKKSITESIIKMQDIKHSNSRSRENDKETKAKVGERCVQASCGTIILPQMSVAKQIISKKSQHLQLRIPPPFSTAQYFIHAIFSSVVYQPDDGDENDHDEDSVYPRYNVRDWCVIDRNVPSDVCDKYIKGWVYDPECSGPRLAVYSKVLQHVSANSQRRRYDSQENATDIHVNGPLESSEADGSYYLHVIFAIRGTDVNDKEDLIDDFLILRGKFTSQNPRVKYYKEKLRLVEKKYGDMVAQGHVADMLKHNYKPEEEPTSLKITITGHSLGGLVAYIVGAEYDCYLYNMASSPFQGVERHSVSSMMNISYSRQVGFNVMRREEKSKDLHNGEKRKSSIGCLGCFRENVEDHNEMNASPEKEPQKSPKRVPLTFHFAPWSDDISASARVKTHWIPQYDSLHPHKLRNHFIHGVRLEREIKKLYNAASLTHYEEQDNSCCDFDLKSII